MDTEVEIVLLSAIFVLIVLIFGTVFGLLYYSGIFHDVVIGAGKPPVANVEVAYLIGRGPYKHAGKLFTQVTAAAPMCRGIGLYYDDPHEVPAAKLRYIVGAIIAEGSELPDKNLKDILTSKGFSFASFPVVTHAVTTTFPYKTIISVFIAVSRVYPKLGEYIISREESKSLERVDTDAPQRPTPPGEPAGGSTSGSGTPESEAAAVQRAERSRTPSPESRNGNEQSTGSSFEDLGQEEADV
ncbi:PREDICTED: testis-expressed sequence 264 protein-like [Priapulus caudatus]|uniref:Testis-expressed sequence 264 protein-like n=1 Tax=Priapulus caudatus TaxID=37621 RepID=A0ABM1E979_PRICU|nr:PREDICTED: testis-expressed sequence 264 protein-like [Priapulus caudatus]